MNHDFSKFKWIWGKMKGHHGIYVLGMVLTVVYNIMQLAVPFYSKMIIDEFLTGPNAAYNLEHDTKRFVIYVVSMVLITLVRTIVVYCACMCYEHASQSALFNIRNELFYKIQHQDMKFYDQFRTGDLMTRLTGDLDAVRHMIAWVLRGLIECIVLFSAAAIYFFILDAKVAACLLLVAPLITILNMVFKKRVAPMHDELREQLSQMNTAAQENISGNRIVKAFAREDYEIKRFHERNVAYSKSNIRTMLEWLRFFPFVQVIVSLLPIILLVVGGIEMINGSLLSGSYFAFSMLIWAIANPMQMLGNILNDFQRFSSASAKVIELENTEPTIVNAPNAIVPEDRLKGKIEFHDVTFSYGGKKVLDHVDITINPGETVAIMGETGSGKTSLIQLIPRFYDPDDGVVCVDGVNVKEYRLEDLRRNIGLATQDVLLYSDTIEGNIAYGNSAMPIEIVKEYARNAVASEFIEKLPDRYDTIIGERGVGLSGGQKQRLSLARAMAIEPSILILDDTTSAVDMETESEIEEHLRNLHFPCTKIIIAQRISATKTADKILIISGGQIIEQGTHEELIAKRGYYYENVMLQTGGEIDG